MEKYQNIVQFRREMRRFFNEYKKKLGINPSWKITLEIKQIRDTWAEVEWDYPKRRFWVFINDKKNATPQELKDSIIHELIHVMLMPYTNRAEQITRQMHADRGTDSKAALKVLDNQEEALVRKLTAVIMGLDKHV
jgi:hypothetical protein